MTYPEFVSLEVLGSDAELSALSRAARGRPSPAGSEQAEGRDDTRAVTVRMDRTGRVTDVSISATWRDVLSPSGLSDALLSAYRAALTRAASALGDDLPRPHRREDPPPVTDTALDSGDAEWLDDVRWRLDRAQYTLDRAEQQRRSGATPRIVAGPEELVRLHVSGDTVTRVEIDVRAASRGSAGGIAADAVAAFRAIH